jgi:ribosomal-protein-alanine N-acetyltransferase
MKTIPVVKTERLRLRPFTPDDDKRLQQLMADHEVMRYFPNPELPALDRVLKMIEAQINHWEEHGYGWWAIEPIAKEQLIGWGGLQWLPETEEIEVAYMLGHRYWGRGLATEIARASLDFGFRVLGIQSIVGIVHLENNASQRVLEKAGLFRTGAARYFGIDCFRYEISNPDPNTE